ncbi:hypothetical protein [Oceanobacillus timonensis]|uniref:hypothetical protein n=1 Tax=Oceanobacillus timonensis TaxID=1926285 RepID=UPI0009BBE223|nr:hypothetical protein [Oceanobacillus timonensis]
MNKIWVLLGIVLVASIIVLMAIPISNLAELVISEPNATSADYKAVVNDGKNYIIIAITIAMVGWSFQRMFLRKNDNE